MWYKNGVAKRVGKSNESNDTLSLSKLHLRQDPGRTRKSFEIRVDGFEL